MELGRCPICHHRISLDAIAKDQAGRELAALVARLDSTTGQALLAYLGLFRSPTRDLANDRALAFAQEVLTLAAPAELVMAMTETVAAVQAKRAQGGTAKPLKNHNYLKAVLGSVQDAAMLPAAAGGSPPDNNAGRTAAATLDQLLDDNW